MRALRFLVYLLIGLSGPKFHAKVSAQNGKWEDRHTVFTNRNFDGKSATYREDIPSRKPNIFKLARSVTIGKGTGNSAKVRTSQDAVYPEQKRPRSTPA